MAHPKLKVLVSDVLCRWCLRVIGENVVALDPAIDGRQRYVVAVEGRTPLVIDDAVCRKVWFRGIFATFEPFNATCDSFNSAANPFLDEIRGEICFRFELVVQCAFGFGLRGNVEAVIAVPTPLACGFGILFELLSRLSEGSVGSFRYVELDYGGTTVVHCISH